MLRKAGLEHEGHGVVQLVRPQIGIGGPLESVPVGSMRQHHVVQRHATRHEALRLGIVLAIDVAHQLGHDVLVIPGRPEGVLGHHPALAEQHEVDVRRARLPRGRGQHGEDRRIGMVEQDRADRAIGAQVVLVGRVIAVPGHHVERAVTDMGLMELSAPLDGHGRGRFAILEGCHRRLEVTRVGHAVGPDRTPARQLELLAVVFTDEAPAGPFQHLDPVDQAARDDGDLLRLEVDDAQLGGEPQPPFLRHHQQLAVGREEIAVHHTLGHKVDMARHPHLRVHVTRRGHGAHARKPGQGLVRMRQGIPAVLAQAGHVLRDMRRGFPVGQLDPLVAVRMLDRGADAIAPGPLGAHIGEGGARKLLAIKTVVAFLRAVHALRQRTGQRLGLEVVAEAGHIAFVGAHRRGGAHQGGWFNWIVHRGSPRLLGSRY